MRRPLTTAMSAAVIAAIVFGCAGWAVVGGVSELLALTAGRPAVQATLPVGRG